jgi:tetratricopeptide (TPR) repeat protein
MTMTAPRFMNNPQYAEYVRLLKALHRRLAEDKDDDEADALRDEMDGPWYSLSEEEIARVDGLAADLYTLDETPPPPAQRDEAAASALSAKIDLCWKAGNWEDILDLLRRNPGVLPPHSEAFLRGWSWNQLGDPDTAALFFQRAAELDPHNAKYPVAVMEARIRAGHIDEALRYANMILDPANLHVA